MAVTARRWMFASRRWPEFQCNINTARNVTNAAALTRSISFSLVLKTHAAATPDCPWWAATALLSESHHEHETSGRDFLALGLSVVRRLRQTRSPSPSAANRLRRSTNRARGGRVG